MSAHTKEVLIKNGVTVDCPCGGQVTFDAESGTGLHSMPTCLRFERMELLDYVTWLRKDTERRKGSIQ